MIPLEKLLVAVPNFYDTDPSVQNKVKELVIKHNKIVSIVENILDDLINSNDLSILQNTIKRILDAT